MENNKNLQNKQILDVSIGILEGNEASKLLITTIIPTYRRPKLLRRAIKSVLNQTYPHFQVCVYDNASGDETAEVVAEFAKKDHRVKYHCHPENIGAMKNFLYGAEHVETPFFSFLSDDDILLPEFYETAMAGFEKYPESMFSATTTICMDEQGNVLDVIGLKWKPCFYHTPYGFVTMLEYGHFVWTGVLFRKEVIEKVGITLKDGIVCEDMFFELRIAAHFPFVVSLKPCAIFMSHPSSTCTKGGLHLYWPYWFKGIENLIEDERIPLDIRLYAEYLLTKDLKMGIFSIAVNSILQKNDEECFKAIDVLHNHYHLKIMAFSLSTIAKACKYFPPVRYSLNFLISFRRFLIFWKDKPHLQKKFGHYAQFLSER
ncbi:MAG: glycosyltransferase family 2 protein [Methanobacteriaceae archaeon]|jgi:glycosyltransferase involved in cell wall biosynthesis